MRLWAFITYHWPYPALAVFILIVANEVTK
jgi:hypothetical protein